VAASFRVAVVRVVHIVILFFAVVFLFVLVRFGLLAKEDIGTRRVCV
jgi:hypothetical protein